MSTPTIAEAWANFAGFVLPANAPAIQREEMRKAFYGGWVDCFATINSLSTGRSEAEATKALDTLNAEAQAFYRELTR